MPEQFDQTGTQLDTTKQKSEKTYRKVGPEDEERGQQTDPDKVLNRDD